MVAILYRPQCVKQIQFHSLPLPSPSQPMIKNAENRLSLICSCTSVWGLWKKRTFGSIHPSLVSSASVTVLLKIFLRLFLWLIKQDLNFPTHVLKILCEIWNASVNSQSIVWSQGSIQGCHLPGCQFKRAPVQDGIVSYTFISMSQGVPATVTFSHKWPKTQHFIS